MTNATPREAARTGLVHVTEGHRVFTQISVADNLLLAGYDLPRSERATRVEETLSFFPGIAEKRHAAARSQAGNDKCCRPCMRLPFGPTFAINDKVNGRT